MTNMCVLGRYKTIQANRSWVGHTSDDIGALNAICYFKMIIYKKSWIYDMSSLSI
jgi:hypothetical protein